MGYEFMRFGSEMFTRKVPCSLQTSVQPGLTLRFTVNLIGFILLDKDFKLLILILSTTFDC